MKKYYKVSESVLLNLLSKARKLELLESGSVNVNARSRYLDLYYDFLKTSCKDNGIDLEQFGEGVLDFSDTTKRALSNFEEI